MVNQTLRDRAAASTNPKELDIMCGNIEVLDHYSSIVLLFVKQKITIDVTLIDQNASSIK